MNRPVFPPLGGSSGNRPSGTPGAYRYLGRGGGERPFRFQLVIALVAGLILVAIPLYLWRRPRPEPIQSADAAVASASARPFAPPIRFDTPPAQTVTLSPFTTLKCENPGPGKTPPERCDHVNFFEEGLARAIRETTACAPRSKSAMQVNYVLSTDYKKKRVTLSPGKMSSVGEDRTRELLRCVKRQMATPNWASIPHQYQRYKVSVVATYPPTTDAPSGSEPVGADDRDAPAKAAPKKPVAPGAAPAAPKKGAAPAKAAPKKAAPPKKPTPKKPVKPAKHPAKPASPKKPAAPHAP